MDSSSCLHHDQDINDVDADDVRDRSWSGITNY